MNQKEYNEAVQRGRDAVELATRIVAWLATDAPDMDPQTVSVACLVLGSNFALHAGVDQRSYMQGAEASYERAELERAREDARKDIPDGAA